MSQPEQWYIKSGQKIQGPFPRAKLEQYGQQGRLKPTMQVSRDRVAWASPVDYGFLGAPRPEAADPGASADGILVFDLINCPGCGVEMPSGHPACPSCGRALRPQRAATGTERLGSGTEALPRLQQPAGSGTEQLPAAPRPSPTGTERMPARQAPAPAPVAAPAAPAQAPRAAAPRAAAPRGGAPRAAAPRQPGARARRPSRDRDPRRASGETDRRARPASNPLPMLAAGGAGLVVLILLMVVASSSNNSTPEVVKKDGGRRTDRPSGGHTDGGDSGGPGTPHRPPVSPDGMGFAEMVAQADRKFAEGDHKGAIYLLSRALKRNEASRPTYLKRARVRMAAGEWEDAQEDLGTCIRLDRDDWEPWYLLGQAQERTDERDGALESYCNAYQQAPPEKREMLAEAIRSIDPDGVPSLQPRRPDEVPVPASARDAIAARLADWDIAGAQSILTSLKARKPAHPAAELADLTVKIRAARPRARKAYATYLLASAERAEAAGRQWAAIAALRNAARLDPRRAQTVVARIGRMRQAPRDALAAKLAHLKSFLKMNLKGGVEKKLGALDDVPQFNPFVGLIAEFRQELAAAARTDESMLVRWQARVAAHPVTFPGERPLTGTSCGSCVGKGHSRCTRCNDKGQVVGTCPTCEGSAKSDCRACRGAGRLECTRCDASGKESITRFVMETCPSCVKRKVGSACATCRGQRQVQRKRKERIACRTCGGTHKAICTKCKGSGKTLCLSCRGQGRGTIADPFCGGTRQQACAPCRGLGLTGLAELALPRKSSLPALGPLGSTGSGDGPTAREPRPPTTPEGPWRIPPAFTLRSDPAGNARREGGGSATEAAVEAGLRWLAAHQSASGQWDADGFVSRCKDGPCPGAARMSWVDPGVTALALLAFMGHGQSHKRGPHRETVARGVRWLMAVQDPDGLVGQAQGHYLYNHMPATLALVEAYALTGDPQVRGAAEKALRYLLSGQTPGAGWRYKHRGNRSDTSATGWGVSALKAARLAGLDVSGVDSGLADALRFIESVSSPRALTGYTRRPPDAFTSATSSRFQALEIQVDTSKTHAPTHVPTAIALYARLATGQRRSSAVAGGARHLLTMPPVWQVRDRRGLSHIDFYYWFYGTLAMFHAGGGAWKTWNAALRPILVTSQRRDGERAGSWDTLGAWGFAGGRVYATAINVLTLEAYYRYRRLE